ncbi:hypothetical protein KCP75_13775 [Salmonella enterica subsp. enterica]|nr:hypothetical protein KCP75_13775 [Salmonella enterica subsp. enterica]
MLKQCGYCRKSIDEGKSKNTLLYLNGSQLARKKGILFGQCAEYDQMAHES